MRHRIMRSEGCFLNKVAPPRSSCLRKPLKELGAVSTSSPDSKEIMLGAGLADKVEVVRSPVEATTRPLRREGLAIAWIALIQIRA